MDYLIDHLIDIGMLLILLAIHHELIEIKNLIDQGIEFICDSIPKGKV